MLNKRSLLSALLSLCVALPALAQSEDTFKIGFITPMTGPFAATGKQMHSAVKLYMAQNGDKVAGRKIELILRDDGGVPDNTKRIAQEMVVNQKVNVLAGFGLTPLAFATATIATQSKTPMVVMAAATESITQASPFVVRTSFALPQAAVAIDDWAPNNGSKKVVGRKSSRLNTSHNTTP